MKKLLIILGMATCLLGMTACGSTKEGAAAIEVDEEGLAESTAQLIDQIAQISEAGLTEQYASTDVLVNAFASWEAASDEIGVYMGVIDSEVTAGADSITITATVQGSEHNATVEIILNDQYEMTSITTNVIKPMSELMKNAALNTLIGMGTVFIVLILIAWLISLFRYIPVLAEKFSRKKKTEAAPAPVAEVAAPVEESVQEDDCELVAVIAAAIAASEGTGTDGFVVRSIRRRTGKWQKA